MKIKNKVLAGLLSLCAVFASVGFVTANKNVTAAADEAAYTVVDSYVMAKTSDGNSANGDFTLWIVLPQLDVDVSLQSTKVVLTDGLWDKLEAIHFFDNILIGEKTLKECGVQGFADSVVDFGNGEPQNVLRIALHADPAVWTALVNSGEIVPGRTATTVKEGALIPSYNYLAGGASPIVYRAGCDYLTKWSDFDAAYSYECFGQTYVENVAYVQGHDGACGYFGFSLHGDDYLGDGAQEEINQTIFWFYEANYRGRFFTQSILVNGEAGKIKSYGLVNLGDNGKGYFAPQIFVPEEDVQTITIPKGTIFPARALNELKELNKPNNVHVFYETTATATYYRNEAGNFVSYNEYLVAEIRNYKAENGYFRADESMQRETIVNNAIAAIQSAATEEDMDAIFEMAKEAIDSLKTAAQYADEELAPIKTSAKETIEGYKANVAYLEEANALLTKAVEDGLKAVADAKNEDEIYAAVETFKTAADALETKETIVGAAKSELEAYLADEDYRDAQAAERTALVAAAKEAIDAATTAAGVAEIVENAKAAIDEIPTASEMTFIELEESRAAALHKVNSKKATVDYERYSEEDIAKINELYRAVKEAIANASSEAEMSEAAEQFVRDINAVPKLAKESKGCGAVVDGASLGLVALLGVAFALKKKEKIA